ncbi:THAP domain-containing protein 1-like isoform X2 [Prorops nasuta]
MTGCSAPGCTNSDQKGYIMKIFPQNPERRIQWTNNVNRKGWKPTSRSFLCEVHFAPEMWENHRADGKRKLRWNAAPTIFGFRQENYLAATENSSMSLALHVTSESVEEHQEKSPSMENNIITSAIHMTSECIAKQMKEDHETADFYSSVKNNRSNDDKCCKEMEKKIKTVEKIMEQQSRFLRKKCASYKLQLQIIKEKLRRARLNEKAMVKMKHQYQIFKTQIQKVFNEDQLKSLGNRRVRNWSNETIKKALHLHFSCGSTGYEELLRQGLPLPGLRTLRRKLQVMQTKSVDGLIFDKMSISSSIRYDNATQSYIGDVTLPEHTDSS